MLRTDFDALEVVRLTRSEWRVTDAADPGNLLGFIERQGADRFEVVWMSDPMRWGYATTFESALVAFGDSIRFTGEVTPGRTPVARAGARFGRGALASPKALTRHHRATWISPEDGSSVAW